MADSLFRRMDESPDELFYAEPRFVTHIDDAAIAAVTQLYRELLPPDGEILDLMSSWISHLPPEVSYRRVVGVGMNKQELAANPRLNSYDVHDLNGDPRLPLDNSSFDAATLCVSIDYLTQPMAVLRDVARVLRAGGPLVITFSNRCFPTKAIAAWHMTDDAGHMALVESWLREAGGWTDIRSLDRSPSRRSDPLYAVVAKRSAM